MKGPAAAKSEVQAGKVTCLVAKFPEKTAFSLVPCLRRQAGCDRKREGFPARKLHGSADSIGAQ